MYIHWTDFAKAELKKIISHYRKHISVEMATNIKEGIFSDVEKLKVQPRLGREDQLTAHLEPEYR